MFYISFVIISLSVVAASMLSRKGVTNELSI